ncbi:MAG: flagellar basal body rod protein FlgC [Gemmatimonadota bacterium]
MSNPHVGPFPFTPRPVRQYFQSLAISSNGMGAQQRFLEVITENISNAETTKTPDGGPYRRQVAVTERDPRTGLLSTRIVEDPRKGRMVQDPTHPDADADGNVFFPNVDINNEMVDLMISRRVHEANVTAFQAAKAMLRRSLEI